MTKKHFIALADAIREHNEALIINRNPGYTTCMFNESQIDAIATFCEEENPQFNRERWLGYIAGTNGKNGGKV